MTGKLRRVVTGHDAEGKAIIALDGDAPVVREPRPGAAFIEVWNTTATPAPVNNGPDPTPQSPPLAPPPNGSVMRVVDMPPGAQSPMHRTETVDYGIVLTGEVYLVVEGGETLLQPGDIVVQRGTNHAWHNRSDQPSRMAFVLIDGRFADE